MDTFKFNSFIYRWFYSTNARDIGVLYLIFAAFSGMLGTAFSMIIRIELSQPEFQFLQGNYQLYNVVITAHALLMIFFMVKKNNSITKLRLISTTPKNPDLNIEPEASNYKTVVIKDPYNNRSLIAALCKGEKGVYLWSTPDEYSYGRHSIYLYNRIRKTFMKSIYSTKNRRVLR